ncbi:CU044_2847 family protein [Spirillospora sp. NPDC050679]
MAEVVRYELDDTTQVTFEIIPESGFRPAGAAEAAGRVRDAVDPVVQAARTVLDKLKETSPDELELKFGVKVSGKANWIVAKAATDANFEVKLIWRAAPAPVPAPVEEQAAEEAPDEGGGGGPEQDPAA